MNHHDEMAELASSRHRTAGSVLDGSRARAESPSTGEPSLLGEAGLSPRRPSSLRRTPSPGLVPELREAAGVLPDPC